MSPLPVPPRVAGSPPAFATLREWGLTVWVSSTRSREMASSLSLAGACLRKPDQLTDA